MSNKLTVAVSALRFGSNLFFGSSGMQGLGNWQLKLELVSRADYSASPAVHFATNTRTLHVIHIKIQDTIFISNLYSYDFLFQYFLNNSDHLAVSTSFDFVSQKNSFESDLTLVTHRENRKNMF